MKAFPKWYFLYTTLTIVSLNIDFSKVVDQLEALNNDSQKAAYQIYLTKHLGFGLFKVEPGPPHQLSSA